jgi:hypothetical protein
MKTHRGVDIWIHVSMTSTLSGGEWSDLCPGRFTRTEMAPGTHWIGNWVDYIVGLNEVKRILDHIVTRNPTPTRPACRQPVYRSYLH